MSDTEAQVIYLHLQEIREFERLDALNYDKIVEKWRKSKKIEKKFEFTPNGCLGKGAYGEVYCARFEKELNVAIKVVKGLNSTMEEEYEIHSKLRHLNVVSVYAQFLSKNQFDHVLLCKSIILFK